MQLSARARVALNQAASYLVSLNIFIDQGEILSSITHWESQLCFKEKTQEYWLPNKV